MATRKKSPVSVVLVLVVCAVAWFWQNRELFLTDPEATGPPPAGESPVRAAPEGRAESGGYEKFEGCRLVDYRNNDGDSFKVRFPDGSEHEMRLYFVDAPESAVKEYRDGNTNRKRLEYQGKDLGGLSERETVAVGQEAKKWTLRTLGKQSFTVFTKWQEVFQSGRYYGFVRVDESGKDQWLHELLVERGLARIYTEGAKLPDGTSRGAQEKRLRKRERNAKGARVGAWGR